MHRILVCGDGLSPGVIPGTCCAGQGEAFLAVAVENVFFDMDTVTTASRVDGIHLDEDQHTMVGNGLALFARDMIDGEVRE